MALCMYAHKKSPCFQGSYRRPRPVPGGNMKDHKSRCRGCITTPLRGGQPEKRRYFRCGFTLFVSVTSFTVRYIFLRSKRSKT